MHNGIMRITNKKSSVKWDPKQQEAEMYTLDKLYSWTVMHLVSRRQHLWMQIWRMLHHEKKNKTRQIWGIWKLRPAYSPETPNLGQNRWCFVPCDLEIWWMTLENNRASLLGCFKLCATFHSHRWIQTGVTVRKRPILVKIIDFFSRVTLQFDVWP